MKKTLFIHIPKTGGTSLSEILSSNFEPHERLSDLTAFSDKGLESAVNSDKFRYISGHIPAGIFEVEKFTYSITVLRNPREIISSLYSFSHRYGYSNPRFEHSVKSGKAYEIYKPYFSKAYDLKRHMLDHRYGIFSDIINYVNNECSVEQALSLLCKFNFIIDFSCLDETVKALIVDTGLFPHRAIPRRRNSKYQPDIDLAERLVSNFDQEFYVRALESCVRRRVTEMEYETYRHQYPFHSGLQLAQNSGLNYPIQNTIGLNWNTVETSEIHDIFRWSERLGVTIEIPVMHPGVYEVYFYTKNTTYAKLIGLQPEFNENVESLSLQDTVYDDLIVTKNVLKFHSSGWADYAVQLEISVLTNNTLDDRELGIILANIYIFRIEDN